ncbi:hypothetical protein FRC04_009580 [Tulasnella sp. 424]|nr:hypothetical protein FRC04_009580 [Tulasnella sp. 424]
MKNFNFNDLLGRESPFSYEDNRFRDPISGFTHTFDPLTLLLPDPLLSSITTSSSPPPVSESTDTVSPALTEEEATHVDNLLFFGIDSPDIPLDLLTPPAATAAAEPPPALVPVAPQPSLTEPTASSVSPLASSASALFSPSTAHVAPSASPPTRKRRFSLVAVDEPNELQEHTAGPSNPRPAKRPCIPYPGESSFQLDATVEPLKATKPDGQPIGKPPRPPRTDYSACRCLGGLTTKPARHWLSCPYNPDAGEKRFTCELCDKHFTREDNKFRHMEDYH